MKKILLLVLFFFLLAVKPVLAADLNIDCPASPTTCSKTGVDPLFSIATDGYWYPGKSITKTLNLKNSGPETREMAIKGTRTSDFSILENVMHISIVGGTTVIWSGSMAGFYNKEKINMGTFAPGANLDYNFTVFMSSGAGDEYQNKETVFDLTLGFWGEPISTPIPTPTSVVNPSSGIFLNEVLANPDSGTEWVEIYNANSYPVSLVNWQFDDIAADGQPPKNMGTINISALGLAVFEINSSAYLNDGGDSARLINESSIQVDIFSYTIAHGGLSWSKQSDSSWCETTSSKGLENNLCPGVTPTATPTSSPSGNPSPPVCSDIAPASAPVLTSAVAGTNSVTLFWNEANGPLTYYLIAFGIQSGVPLYGNPNIGGLGTTSYIVTNLSAGQLYYFKVRAGNGCMPGPFSNELSAVPLGTSLAVGVPPGFQEGVLGAQEGPEGELNGGISSQEGTLVEGVKIEKVCPFWWIVLIGQTVVLGIFYALNRRRKEWMKRWWLVTAAMVLLAYYIDHYAHTHWYIPSSMCRWEIWLGILLAGAETIVFKTFKKEQ